MSKAPVRRRTRPNASTNPHSRLISDINDDTPRHRPLRIDHVPVDQLRQPNRKLRRYRSRQLAALKASIVKFGMLRPVLADKDGTIIAGVAVWLVAKDLSHETIPVIRIEHLSPQQIRLYRIADNKLVMGEFDEDELRLEFLELSDLSIEVNLDIDLEDSGFTTKEIDDITLRQPSAIGNRGAGGGGGAGDEDDDCEPGPGMPVARSGDIWLIGDRHKIICGNSLEAETYAALMGNELAQMVVSDGPYNVEIKGNVSSNPNAHEFAFASGDMSSEQFVAFQRTVFGHLVRYSVDGSIHYQFMSWADKDNAGIGACLSEFRILG